MTTRCLKDRIAEGIVKLDPNNDAIEELATDLSVTYALAVQAGELGFTDRLFYFGGYKKNICVHTPVHSFIFNNLDKEITESCKPRLQMMIFDTEVMCRKLEDVTDDDLQNIAYIFFVQHYAVFRRPTKTEEVGSIIYRARTRFLNFPLVVKGTLDTVRDLKFYKDKFIMRMWYTYDRIKPI